MMAADAEHSQSSERGSINKLITWGQLSAALSLAIAIGCRVLNHNFDLVSFYIFTIVPIGAMIAGLIAGAGYGWAASSHHIKISPRRMLLVFILLTVTFLLLKYLPSLVYAAKEKESSRSYLFIALEFAAFMACGLLPSLILKRAAYCDQCQQYMTKITSLKIPASAKYRQFSPANMKEKEAYDELNDKFSNIADESMAKLLHLIHNDAVAELTNHAESLMGLFDKHSSYRRHLELELSVCKGCSGGLLKCTNITWTPNSDKSSRMELFKATLTPEQTQGILTVTPGHIS